MDGYGEVAIFDVFIVIHDKSFRIWSWIHMAKLSVLWFLINSYAL